MTDAVLGIDVSKNTFDTNLGAGTKARSKSFANSPAGWHHLIAWLGEHKIGQVHACLEATGRHGLGIALALHEAGHVVSIVNPAQIRDFARTKLGRNKTDQVDAVHIREYAELFKPRPWTPPSPAMRRLCELQTIRAGTVAGLTEWKNRRGSGIMDDLALSLAKTTIQHFTSQLEAVDQAIAETIDNDVELSAKRDLLVSINGVGEALAGIVLAELPGPDILGSSAAVTAYAGLNPQQHQSGISVNRPVRISKIQCRAPHRLVHAGFVGDALQPSGRCFGRSAQGSGPPQGKADCDRCHAQASGALLRRAEDRQGIRPGDGDR
jgi:transposase